MDSLTARTSTSTAESMKATMATGAVREPEEPLAGDVRPGPGLAQVAGREIRLGGEGVEDAGREAASDEWVRENRSVSEALRQARRDAELAVSADSV